MEWRQNLDPGTLNLCCSLANFYFPSVKLTLERVNTSRTWVSHRADGHSVDLGLPPTTTSTGPASRPLRSADWSPFRSGHSTLGAGHQTSPFSAFLFPSSPLFSVCLRACLILHTPRMSVAVAERCFLSALQPNTSCTAYVVPSDGPSPDPTAKARRVREQVRMRLAEKKSSSLPRLDDSLAGSTGEMPRH